jgi:hypothetical protein
MFQAVMPRQSMPCVAIENSIGAPPPPRSLKRANIDAERALAASMSRGDTLSATDFDQSEWEIMYHRFIKEGLIDPSNCVNRRIF